jgi:hypothetical protein
LLYPVPEIGLTGDADVPSTGGWCLALLVAAFDFWCLVLTDDSLAYVGKHSLMSSDTAPSSVLSG